MEELLERPITDELGMQKPTLAKSANVSEAQVGETIVYTFLIHNPLDEKLFDLIMVDQVQTDLVDLQLETIQVNGVKVCEEAYHLLNATLTVKIPYLDPGYTDITFRANVKETAAGASIQGTAILYGRTDKRKEHLELDVDNDEVMVAEEKRAPTPTLIKSANVSKVKAGERITYTLRVHNPLNERLSDFIVVDHMQTDLVDFKLPTVRAGEEITTYNFYKTEGCFIAEMAYLEPGDTDISFEVTVKKNITKSIIQNTATLYGSKTLEGSRPELDRSEVDVATQKNNEKNE